VIVASAGATHPLASWLTALNPGGKLLFPLTPDYGAGAMAYITRKAPDNFEAHLMFGVQFIPFSGARDLEISKELAEALNRDAGATVRSLRCDRHVKDESCWLHGENWCFSTRESIVID
jgi:protein-L-isoaspartate(D-aspartate) O-methyltransferase